MFKRITTRIASLFRNNLMAQSLAHFFLLTTVTLVFVWLSKDGYFSRAPTYVPPPEYSRLKELSSVELENQLKSTPPDIVGLVFFDRTKTVAVMRKGFEKDRIVLDADLEEMKDLSNKASVPVSTLPSKVKGSFFDNVHGYWYPMAIALFVWLVLFLFLKREEFIPSRAVATWQFSQAYVDNLVERKKWRKGPFYLTVWFIALAVVVLLSASRLFHYAPTQLVPTEYDSTRMPGWQGERLVAKSPRDIDRAVVIDGANAVYLIIQVPASELADPATPAAAPAPKQPVEQPPVKRPAGEVQPPAAVKEPVNDAGGKVARLVVFGPERPEQESFTNFVATLKSAKIPTKRVESVVKDSWVDTMPLMLALAHVIATGVLLFSLFAICEQWKHWEEQEAPKKAARGATVGGGVATTTLGNTKVKKEDVKTLDDVAGCEEAVKKFRLVAEWLRNAKAYNHFNAKLPKGVLLSGPPGTGKTLLARALAGEVGGNYFQASASEFIEMYVGVGASRVRDLFGKAKAAYRRTGRPSIVFIDEIDAVGKPRSETGTSGDGERDQTLNQLLTCIQGFDPNNGTLVIAATNRPETLDSALTRSGRFDYKIEVSKPDRKGRKAIFGVHARNVELAPGVCRDALYDKLARRAHDFSGADIELAVNHAVTRAAERNAPSFVGKSDEEIAAMPKIVLVEDFDAGVDAVLYGELIKSKVRTDKERKATAIHEIGHAAIPTVLNGDPVSRITIVMTTKSLGLMESYPEEDRYGWSKEQFLLRIKTMLAGRAAESELGGEVSTGASNDFERASQLARMMVGAYGMSELGPISLPLDQHGFPRTLIGGGLEAEFNAAWRKIISDCNDETIRIVKENGEKITRVAAVLLEEETLTGDRFRELWSEGTTAQQ
jgi:cell division protease FtsH